MKCLETEYGHPCNSLDDYGKRTLGENMADQLGVKVSLSLYREQVLLETATRGNKVGKEDYRDFFRKHASLWCESGPNVPGSSSSLSAQNLNRFLKSASVLSETSTRALEGEEGRLHRAVHPERRIRERGGGAFYHRKGDALFGLTNGKEEEEEEEDILVEKRKTIEEICASVYGDVHALSRHRVDATLRQFVEFRKAFQCRESSPMTNSEPCIIY
jgi:hypothetical protein